MSRFSSRKKERRPRETYVERRTKYWPFDWPDQWGAPPAIILFLMWSACGAATVGCAVLGFNGVNVLWQEGILGFVLGLGMMAIGGGGVYIMGRAWWNLTRHLFGFPPPVVRMEETDSAPSAAAILGNLVPHSRQYDEAAERCRVALEKQFEARQVSPKGVSRLNSLLRQVVEPAVAGQIELIEAFEIRSGKLVIHYGIVSYNESIRSGKSVHQSTGVGQLTIIPTERELCRIRIKPESLIDKFGELFSAQELDFSEHPRFSRQYLLFAENKDAISLQVPDDVWQTFGEASDLVVAGKGSTWVIGQEGALLPDRAVALARVALEVAGAFASAPR